MYCVLKTATEGSEAGGFGKSSRCRIEDFWRCVDPTQPSPLTITSSTRIVLEIESAVIERANGTCDLRKCHPGSTKECLMAWQTKMRKMLKAFDVRDSQFTVPTISKKNLRRTLDEAIPSVSEISINACAVLSARSLQRLLRIWCVMVLPPLRRSC